MVWKVESRNLDPEQGWEEYKAERDIFIDNVYNEEIKAGRAGEEAAREVAAQLLEMNRKGEPVPQVIKDVRKNIMKRENNGR